MLLLLDAGNTRLKLAAAGESGPHEIASLPTSDAADATRLGHLLDRMQRERDDAIERIALVSVVPAVASAVAETARQRSLPLLVADAATIPIEVRTPYPSAIGADRLLNAYAAAQLHGAPVMVADFGTASTFDAVDRDGCFVGGAIAPGLMLGIEALAARTALLPRVEPRLPERAIGGDTVSALQSGAVIGHIGVARELIGRIRRELGGHSFEASYPTAVATGGLAALPWIRELPEIDVVDPLLTLRGLTLVASGVAVSR